MPLVLLTDGHLANMSRTEFFEFCQRNRDLRIERSAAGDLSIMTPTGGDSGRRNFGLVKQLANWIDRDGTGIGFDSSTGFWLPNGALRSPDASWVRRERWDALTKQQQKEFVALAPDFVVELRSSSERLTDLRAKMQEYVDNGVRLAWLIDPTTRRVEIYRPGQQPVAMDNPTSVSAEPELAGFVLDLTAIWQ